MMNDQDSNMAMNAICHATQMIQASIQEAVAGWGCPSAIYKPKLYVDGNQWCALYGDDLQSGVAGFGDSPWAAMNNFDAEWFKPINTKEQQ